MQRRRALRYPSHTRQSSLGVFCSAVGLKSNVNASDRPAGFGERFELAAVDQRRWHYGASAQINIQRHYVALAQRIDCVMRDLGKALITVIPQRSSLLRE